MPKIWSVLWTATSATLNIYWNSALRYPNGVIFGRRLITTRLLDMITNGVGVKAHYSGLCPSFRQFGRKNA